jgi:hypothetical protein
MSGFSMSAAGVDDGGDGGGCGDENGDNGSAV